MASMRGYQRGQRQLPALKFPLGVVTKDFLKTYIYGLASNYTGVTRAEIIESSTRELKTLVAKAMQSLVESKRVLVLRKDAVPSYATVQTVGKRLAEVDPFASPVNLQNMQDAILEALSCVRETTEAHLFDFFKGKLLVLIARADRELKEEGKIRMFEDCYEVAYTSRPFKLRQPPRSPYTQQDVTRFVLKLLVLGDKKWEEVKSQFDGIPPDKRSVVLEQATESLNGFIARGFVRFQDGVYCLNPHLSKHAWNVHDAVKAYFNANRQPVRSDFVEQKVAQSINLNGASDEDKLLLVFAALAQLEQLEFITSSRQQINSTSGQILITVWTPTQKLLNGG
ncbi:hypothetical protein HY992_00840 [Candidatus Micrarchaeota archaeon]|nr:hypothetical protein [Candidatus Micrarchaeota archaeon]